jgi:hypothetical protein
LVINQLGERLILELLVAWTANQRAEGREIGSYHLAAGGGGRGESKCSIIHAYFRIGSFIPYHYATLDMLFFAFLKFFLS